MKTSILRFPQYKEPLIKTKLGDLVSIFNGYAFKSSDSSIEGVRWLKIADVGIQQIKNDTLSFLPTNYAEQYKKFILNKGDLVIALTRPVLSNQLKIARVDQSAHGSLLNQRVGKIKTSENLNYVYYLMQCNRVITSIVDNIAGTDPPNLAPSEIKNISIQLCTKQEQQKIADFLTSVDTKISQLTEKHRLLKEYKKGVMQQTFSQQIRFKDENGEAFPEWEVKQLDQVFEICYGKDFKHLKDGNVPVLGTGGIMTFVDSYLYDQPSVLIGRKGTIDKPQFITIPFWTVDTLFYTKIKQGHDPKFVFYICQMINWKKYNEATGVPSLNTSSISRIKVSIPNLIEQEKLVQFIESIDAKIDAVNQQIEQAKQFKKGLLQQMFV